jgi:hypothetical protein
MKRKRHTALSKDQSRKRSGDYLTNNNNNLPSDIKTRACGKIKHVEENISVKHVEENLNKTYSFISYRNGKDKHNQKQSVYVHSIGYHSIH